METAYNSPPDLLNDEPAHTRPLYSAPVVDVPRFGMAPRLPANAAWCGSADDLIPARDRFGGVTLASLSAPIAQTDLTSLLSGIKQLPTPPMVFAQINRVLSNPEASLYDLARIISEDPSMSARVLRMANSAYYALASPVVSVRQATVILGTEAVRSIVLTASVFQAFGDTEIDPEFHDKFWCHSLATASAARVLMGTRNGSNHVRAGEEGFSTGLLHDIGKIVLISHLPEHWARIIAHPDFGVREDREIEQEIMGVTHAEIGGHLARSWNLPEELCNAIIHHHDLKTLDGEHLALSKVIHLADYLAHWIMITGPDINRRLPEIDPDVAAEFSLSPDSLPELGGLVRTEFGRSEVFLEMARAR